MREGEGWAGEEREREHARAERDRARGGSSREGSSNALDNVK